MHGCRMEEERLLHLSNGSALTIRIRISRTCIVMVGSSPNLAFCFKKAGKKTLAIFCSVGSNNGS